MAIHARSAFTLVELVVVMVMMGICAAIVLPRYSSSISNYRVDAATQRIIGDLRAARRQANIISSATVFKIDQPTSTYTITGMNRLDRRGGVYTVDLGADPYFATVTEVDLDSGSTVITDPFGQITGSGTMTITVGAFKHIVAVDAANGEIAIK